MKKKKTEKIDIKEVQATLKHGRFNNFNILAGAMGIVFSFIVLTIWLLFINVLPPLILNPRFLTLRSVLK